MRLRSIEHFARRWWRLAGDQARFSTGVYAVSGSRGSLDKKIPLNQWPGILFSGGGSRCPLVEKKRGPIISSGPHAVEILRILENDLKAAGTAAAAKKAERIIELSVDPNGGPPSQPSDGLLYTASIQSGKNQHHDGCGPPWAAEQTDFSAILVLTTDNDLLYDQTLERVRAGLRGLKRPG